jgi:hypothetical protein
MRYNFCVTALYIRFLFRKICADNLDGLHRPQPSSERRWYLPR